MVGNEQWRVIADGRPYNCSVCEQRSTEEFFVQESGRVTVPHIHRCDQVQSDRITGQLTTALRGYLIEHISYEHRLREREQPCQKKDVIDDQLLESWQILT